MAAGQVDEERKGTAGRHKDLTYIVPWESCRFLVGYVRMLIRTAPCTASSLSPYRAEVHPGLPRGDVQVDATQVCIALPLDHAAWHHNGQASGGSGSGIIGGEGEGGEGSSPGATAGLAGIAGSVPAVTMQQQQQRPPLPQQQVFAFLPLRSYGLRLVVQVRGSRRGEGRTRGKGGELWGLSCRVFRWGADRPRLLSHPLTPYPA